MLLTQVRLCFHEKHISPKHRMCYSLLQDRESTTCASSRSIVVLLTEAYFVFFLFQEAHVVFFLEPQLCFKEKEKEKIHQT